MDVAPEGITYGSCVLPLLLEATAAAADCFPLLLDNKRPEVDSKLLPTIVGMIDVLHETLQWGSDGAWQGMEPRLLQLTDRAVREARRQELRHPSSPDVLRAALAWMAENGLPADLPYLQQVEDWEPFPAALYRDLLWKAEDEIRTRDCDPGSQVMCIRRWAEDLEGALEAVDAVGRLGSCLNDPERILKRLGMATPNLPSALVEVLTSTTSPALQARAAWALGRYGGPDVALLLIEQMERVWDSAEIAPGVLAALATALRDALGEVSLSKLTAVERGRLAAVCDKLLYRALGEPILQMGVRVDLARALVALEARAHSVGFVLVQRGCLASFMHQGTDYPTQSAAAVAALDELTSAAEQQELFEWTQSQGELPWRLNRWPALLCTTSGRELSKRQFRRFLLLAHFARTKEPVDHLRDQAVLEAPTRRQPDLPDCPDLRLYLEAIDDYQHKPLTAMSSLTALGLLASDQGSPGLVPEMARSQGLDIVSTVANVLHKAGSADLRAEAAWALAQLGGYEASHRLVERLIFVCQSDSEPPVAQAALVRAVREALSTKALALFPCDETCQLAGLHAALLSRALVPDVAGGLRFEIIQTLVATELRAQMLGFALQPESALEAFLKAAPIDGCGTTAALSALDEMMSASSREELRSWLQAHDSLPDSLTAWRSCLEGAAGRVLHTQEIRWIVHCALQLDLMRAETDSEFDRLWRASTTAELTTRGDSARL